MSQLHIKPHGEHFAIWDGDKMFGKCVFTSRAGAVQAIADWRMTGVMPKFEGPNIMIDGRDLWEILAKLATRFDKRDVATIASKGGKERQRRRRDEEEDEPAWAFDAKSIAKKARADNPAVTSTDIAKQIGEVCQSLQPPPPKFRMLMTHIARWEAGNIVPRKVRPLRRR
jgi:hypothetical protein